MQTPLPPPGLDAAQLARTYELLAEHERRHARGRRLPVGKHEELHSLLAQKGGHLYEGRIPMNDLEHTSVDKLLNRHVGATATLARRDPGETGPLVVDIEGAGLWHVDAAGKATKQRAS